MTIGHTGIGFQNPVHHLRRVRAQRTAIAELLMAVSPSLCLAVALTAVTVSMLSING